MAAAPQVAAFLLDHGGFAGVPPTALVRCEASSVDSAGAVAPGGAPARLAAAKVGSLQAFVPADGDAEEHGVSRLPVHQVHKIAQLDLRLANTDRNGAPLLCVRACHWSACRRCGACDGEH